MRAVIANMDIQTSDKEKEKGQNSRQIASGRGLCGLCNLRVAQYKCPRCPVSYCSLGCYRSDAHGACSETFYKEEMVHALKGKTATADEKRGMMALLQRIEAQNRDEAGSGGEGASGDESTGATAPDLADRIAGIDLEDDGALVKLWDVLTPDELADFKRLAESDAAGHILPQWVPWWRVGAPRPVITPATTGGPTGDFEDGEGSVAATLDEQGQLPQPLQEAAAPPTMLRLPALTDLLGEKPPAKQLPANLIEILLSYCYVARILNGSLHDDPVSSAVLISDGSAVLADGAVYDTETVAVHSFRGRVLASAGGGASNEQTLLAIEDVVMLLGSDVAVKRALADVAAVLCKAHATLAPRQHQRCPLSSIGVANNTMRRTITISPHEGEGDRSGRREAKIAMLSMERKLVFYGSWWEWAAKQADHSVMRDAMRDRVQRDLEVLSEDNRAVVDMSARLQQQWQGQRPPERTGGLITELS